MCRLDDCGYIVCGLCDCCCGQCCEVVIDDFGIEMCEFVKDGLVGQDCVVDVEFEFVNVCFVDE